MRDIKRLVVSLLGYALASVAGYVAHRIGVPLAWLIGPLIVSASLSLSDVRYYAPVWLRRSGQLIIGCAAGLTVTSEVLSGLVSWIPFMILTSLFSIFCAAGLSPFLARFAHIDTKTSFFSLMPGGMAEMSNIGNDVGAKSEIYKLIKDLASSGMGVIVVSSEIPEILALSNRVLVMCEGEITADFSVADANEANLLTHAIHKN